MPGATHYNREIPAITVAVTRETDDRVWFRLVTNSMDDEQHTSRANFDGKYAPLTPGGATDA